MRGRALVAAAVFALAGCSLGGDDGPAIEAAQLSKLVLQPADLPRVFIQFDEGRQAATDQPGAAPDRFGRADGWKARYRRPGSVSTAGPLVVESKADLFGGSGGAGDELERARDNLPEGFALESTDPGIGEESFAATGTQGSGRFTVRFYLAAWRYENAVGSVLVNGFDRRVTLAQTVALARKQQRRIEASR